jgi:two-component system, OmpR family, sensor histidine kinase KdpD
MRSRIPDTLLRIGFSLLAVALTTALLRLAQPWLSTPTIALLYLLPVGVSTALWGLPSGVAAAVAAFLSFNYFFLPPFYTLRVLRPQEALELIVFLIVAIVLSQLLGAAQAGLSRAQAREREARHLSELSTALLGQADLPAIARAIAERILLTLPGSRVGILLRPDAAFPAIECFLPPGARSQAGLVTSSLPIQGSRGLLGEILVWTGQAGLSEAQASLLHTYSLTAALAIERSQLAEAENRARLLAQSDAFKSALLSSVSHDLRSPLVTIKASITSLLANEVDWDTDARQELLEAVDEETDHLNMLVGNLLDMTRIEAGSLQPKRNWNVLADIVRSVTVRLRNSLRAHTLAIEVSDDLPLVPVDYIQMEQVLVNLLSNSTKYSAPGSTIRVVAAPVEGSWMKVQVLNQGPSVSAEDLDRIFDKFHRVTASDRVTGIGLGLSICKGIIEAHGGRIWAENTGEGMAFNFTLPLTWEGAGPSLAEME